MDIEIVLRKNNKQKTIIELIMKKGLYHGIG